MKHYVIGAGGVGSWLVPKLKRLIDPKTIVMVDGDSFEKKNMDRQLFLESHIGVNKAEAMSQLHGLGQEGLWFIPEYYHVGLLGDLTREDFLWCCADNHACRREVLYACDQYRCNCVIMANEFLDFEAYFYEPSMQGTPNDPRVFYPNILTDNTGDPLRPAGCVELSRSNEQLVIANATAADFGLWLWWFHAKERPKMPKETQEFWPVAHRGNHLRMRTTLFKDRLG